MTALITYLCGALGGWCLRIIWVETVRFRRAMKSLKQLAREQDVKPVRDIGALAADDGARLTDEEFESWTAAMRELREP